MAYADFGRDAPRILEIRPRQRRRAAGDGDDLLATQCLRREAEQHGAVDAARESDGEASMASKFFKNQPSFGLQIGLRKRLVMIFYSPICALKLV